MADSQSTTITSTDHPSSDPSSVSSTAPTTSSVPGAQDPPTTKKPRFAPKEPVQLDPPKDDPFTLQELALCDGTNPPKPTLLAILSKIYNVSGNSAYAPGGNYHVLAGKDASRALAKTSLNAEDCTPLKPGWRERGELEAKEIQTLEDWDTFFGFRYNVVGRLVLDQD